MYESIPRKIWRIIYPAFLLLAAYLAVYFVAILTYTNFFMSMYPTLEHFMGAAGDIVSIIALTAGGFLAFWFYKRDYVIYSERIFKKPIFLIPVAAAGMLLGHGLSIFASLINLTGIFGSYNLTESSITVSGVLITILKTVILAPLAEELAFRGLLYKRMEGYTSFWPAALISAFFFGVYHLNVLQGIYAFIYGIILCIIYKMFNNIVVPMVMHAAANLFSVLFQVSGLDYPSIPAYVIAMVIALAAGALILIFVNKKWKKEGR